MLEVGGGVGSFRVERPEILWLIFQALLVLGKKFWYGFSTRDPIVSGELLRQGLWSEWIREGWLMQIEMTIKGLMVDPVTSSPIILLRDSEGERILPIWVGVFEANAIALQIENVSTPRPMTHDLLNNVIQGLNASLEKVVVCEIKDSTFYALMHLRLPDGMVIVDARPSDAIALALRASAPIFVDEDVIEGAKSLDFKSEQADSVRLQKWLENLNPEDLGKYKM